MNNVLADLEMRVIEFFSEWLVALLMPARHVLETRSPHLSFMLLKDYWFKELYLGLKVAASLDRTESYIKTIEGQVRCITAEFKQTGANVAWNVSYINVFIPAWMVPPMYHSLRREEIKCRNSRAAMGVKSIRPTWFEDETAAKTTAEPMHGLRLIIKEDVPPLGNHPRFEALEEVAKRGLLAAETWHCNRPHVSLKTTVDVPLLGTVIEQNGDGCLEDSLMPVGWPLHLDGAVKQRCLHRTTTLSELNGLLQAYDMKRNLVELNYAAAQWKHKAVWNKWYMEARRGYQMIQLWNNHETEIAKKTSNSYEAKADDIHRAASAAAKKPSARLPDSMFLRTLGTDDVYTAPPQTGSLSLRAAEEWERCICENKAFSILNQAQEGRPELIKKDGVEMLVSIVLDRPLDDAKALVEDPERLISEITAILESNQSHPVLDQMVNPDVRDDLPIAEFTAASSSSGFGPPRRATQADDQQDRFQ